MEKLCHNFKIEQMKTHIKYSILSSIIVITSLIFLSCSKENGNNDQAQYASILQVDTDGTTTVINENLQSVMVSTAMPNETEIAFLLQMKEEEKLAHDVYSVLFEKWDNKIFSNIATAESKHLNAIILLLKTYGVADTLISEQGAFSNSEIKALYDELALKGTSSVEDALKTGALIEEMDINDLQNALGKISNENINIVFENLQKGSRNHLRAFNRQLTYLGLTYTPQILDQSTFNQIVSSSMEQGKQYKMKQNGKGNGKGKGKGKKGNGNGSCNN